MKVFISWSGQRSRCVAEELRRWLPRVLQTVTPFVSSTDLQKGGQWSPALSQELNDTDYGILCLTRENLQAPYLHFEAGALSKLVKQSHVSPLLIGDLTPVDVAPPLSQFQLTQATQDDIRQLVVDMNRVNTPPLDIEVVRDSVDRWWPDLDAVLTNVAAQELPDAAPARGEAELLEEILSLLRLRTSQDRRLFESKSVGAGATRQGAPQEVLEMLTSELSRIGLEGPLIPEGRRTWRLLVDRAPSQDQGRVLEMLCQGLGVRLFVESEDTTFRYP